MTEINKKKYFAKGFLAIMSNGPDIAIDEDEVEMVLRSAAKGEFYKARQGVVNPSFLVSVVEDVKRRKDFEWDKHHEPEVIRRGMDTLENIFLKKEKQLGLPGGSPPGMLKGGTGDGKFIGDSKTSGN